MAKIEQEETPQTEDDHKVNRAPPWEEEEEERYQNYKL